jgi:hypothetical protein
VIVASSHYNLPHTFDANSTVLLLGPSHGSQVTLRHKSTWVFSLLYSGSGSFPEIEQPGRIASAKVASSLCLHRHVMG